MKNLKILLISPLLVLLLGVGAMKAREFYMNQKLLSPTAPVEAEWTVKTTAPETPTLSETPVELNLELAFFTQAPYSNWDYPWQEACEEASVLLVANKLLALNLSTETYNTELLDIVNWEIDRFGAYEHTTAEQTAEILKERYGLGSKIHDNPTFEDIQKILNEGHFIIAPFAGKKLNNPNFKNGGPNYHMLVIKGYRKDPAQIVTHDVGTRNGANYVYSWETIQNALHDWSEPDILEGTPRIIEVLNP